jgi:hypothetical protein
MCASRAPRSRSRLIEAFTLLGALSVLSVAMNWPVARVLATRMPAPFGDPGLNAWILGWGADRLAHGLRGLWTAPIFFPFPDTFAYSEHLLGISFFVAPVYWSTRNPTLVYNLAFLATPVLAGAAMYILVKSLTRRRDAALLAAVAFAFPPLRVAQLSHLQVLAYGWMPLAVWSLRGFLRDGSRPALLVFAASFLMQALSNGYYLFFLSVPVAIVAMHGLWRAGTARWRRLGGLALACLAIVVVLSPVAAAYARVRYQQGLHRSRREMVRLSADLPAYGRVSDNARFWRQLLPHGGVELALFPGGLVSVLAVCALLGGVFRPREAGLDQGVPSAIERAGGPRASSDSSDDGLRADARLFAVVTVAAFVLSLGPEPRLWGALRLPTGPYDWLRLVPGVDGLRVPARMGVVVQFGLVVLAGLGAARLLARLSQPVTVGAVSLACAVLLVEGYGGPVPTEVMPTSDMARARPAYFWLASMPPGPVLELPADTPRLNLRYMWQALVHRQRIVNGHSGYGSALLRLMRGPAFMEPDHLPQAVEMLQVIGVTRLLVHTDLYPDLDSARALRQALRAMPRPRVSCQAFDSTEACVISPYGASRPALEPRRSRTLDPSLFTLSASHGTRLLDRVRDGDPSSRWFTGRPQSGNEWLQIALDRPRRLAHLRIGMDRATFWDYPRRLAVETSLDGRNFATALAGGALPALALSLVERPAEPGIDVALHDTEARIVRLRQTGRASRHWSWSVNEITLWETTEAVR